MHSAMIRPPESTGVLTVSIAADSVNEGNPAVSLDIRLSDAPDADAEVPTVLFVHGVQNAEGFAVTPTRLLIASGEFGVQELRIAKFTHAGVQQVTETLLLKGAVAQEGTRAIDFFNGDILVAGANQLGVYGARYKQDGNTLQFVRFYLFEGFSGITHTRYGVLGDLRGRYVYQLGDYETTTTNSEVNSQEVLAHSQDFVYTYLRGPGGNNPRWSVLEVLDPETSEDTFLEPLPVLVNIEEFPNTNSLRDIAIYQDTLYILTLTDVRTLDIRKYRPVAKRTKTTIYPVFANEGDTIDLTQYSPDAERIVPDVGFDKPDYLTFNTSNELVIDADAVTETGPCLHTP